MTKDQFSEVFKIAQDTSIECPSNNAHIFDGFGLHDFKPVVCSTFDLAELMRYQARQLNGNWDMDAIQEIYDVKHK
ncbi:hypothetical protein GM547_13885, partial [Streptococcus pneumoniae]|uniref:hypothetical protein n=1 Tax=Streptococcus pneumoniae TaxID=1313 RepID=UPI0012D7441F